MTAKQSSSVTRVRLNNGLTVILEPNHSCSVAAINVWVKVGSGCEREDERGIAHLHEHMLFKGTDSLGPGELAFEVESAGGRINAFTSFDQTVYHITSAAGSLDRSIDLLADSVLNSTFDKGELEKEIEVVVEEIRRDKDSPENALSRRLFASAYEKHPYGHSILGSEQSVRSFTRAKILNFYRKWYCPQNIVVVIVGDFEPEPVLGRVKKRFGLLKKKRSLSPRLAAPPPGRKSPSVSVLKSSIKEGYFALAFRTPGIGGDSEDIAVLDIISEAMGGGESSRLFRVVKEEKGIVDSVYSYSYAPVLGGIFVVGGTVKPGKTALACGEILRMFYALADSGLEPSEIEKAKLNIESDGVRSRETMQGRANSLGFYEAIAGDFMFEKLYMEKVRSVGRDDIRRVAAKYFTPSNLCAAALVPSDSAVSEKQLKKAVANPERKNLRPGGKYGKTGIHNLENGMRVIIKENKSVPLFAVRLLFPAGLRFENKSVNGISNLMANMLTRGTSSRSAKQIAEEMESLAGHLEGFSGRDSAGISMEALSSNFDSAMDIFSDVALSPSFPEDEARRAKREILASINRKGDNLSSVCIDRFFAALFKGSPYSRNVEGTAGNVKKFSGKNAADFYRKTLRPEDIVLVVVGDVETGRVLRRVEKDFAPLRKVRKTVPPPARPEFPGRPVQTVKNTRDKQQTHIVVGFSAPGINSADRHPFQVLNTVLSGQGGRLFMKLRDEMSLAYSVTSFYGAHLESGYFGVYIGTAPHKEKSALEEILNQLSAVLRDGVSKDEVERARSKIVGDFEIGLQRNSAQASVMGFDELYGVGWDEHKKFARKVLAVTPEEVFRVAKKYIKLDSRVVSVVRGKGSNAR